jgi:hypothetical protein
VGKAAMMRTLLPDPDTFRDLFFRHLGVVDMTAAKPGQAAVGNGLDGGYFTTGIVDTLSGLPRAELDDDHSGIVTWPEAFAVIRGQTESTFDRYHPEGLRVGGRLQRDQTPTLLGPVAASTGRAIPRSPARLGVAVDDAPEGGARVKEVLDDSPAAWAGLGVGDRILGLSFVDARGEAHDAGVRVASDLGAALARVPGAALVSLTLALPPGTADDVPPDRLIHLAR